MAKDFYKILGVERTADEKEIKKAYRKMARQHHPDINPNDKNAEARFKEINEAYQVLSDKEKRALFDQFGSDYDKVQTGAPGGAGGYGATGGPNLDDLFGQVRRGQTRGASGGFNTRTENIDPGQVGDLFESLFGGARGKRGSNVDFGGGMGGARRNRGPQKGQDVEQPIEVSLGESIKGTQRSLRLTIETSSGEENRSVTVKIPAGVQEGARVRVAKQGASGSMGGPNGDLFLVVHIAPHPFWKRDGDNLHCEMPLSFSEAALGATIGVPTAQSEVQLRVPVGTQSGQTFRLSGRGVPHLKGEGAGDVFVKVKVAVPKNLTARETELVEELAQERTDNVRAGLTTNF